MKVQDAAEFQVKLMGELAPFKWLISALMGVVSYALPTEAMRGMAIGAAVLIVVDTVTGVVASVMTGKPITSARFARFFSKVLGYAAVVAVCAVVTKTVPGLGEYQSMGTGALLTFVVLTEGISIIENARKMGLPIPGRLEEWLKGARDKETDSAEKAE